MSDEDAPLAIPVRFAATYHLVTAEGKVAAVVEMGCTYTTEDGVVHAVASALNVRDALQLAKHIADTANEALQAAKARARQDDSRN
jgi:hypothetical protein